MLRLPVPDSSNATVPITLGGKLYDFVFELNTIDRVFRVNIYYQGALIIGSVDLKLGSILLKKHVIPDFDHGDLFLFKVKKTIHPPTKGNIGIDKDYELLYLTNEDLGVQ